jgi:acetolactate synthase-1/2/3 large subunit
MSMTESQAATVTVGEALAETLARAGVKIAFTVPGESLLGLLEGLQAHRIRIVTTRHEGAASFMAEAVAQLTGRPTLVMAGRAPGAANLAIGLQAAYADSAPVVAIVGQVRREFRGREAFQELDVVRTFEPVVKWAAEAREPGEVTQLADRAVGTALRGRPGPALLAVPEDLLDMAVPLPQSHPSHADHQPEPDPTLVRKVLRLLLAAERPLILAGAGVLRARSTDALVRFAETVQVPVVASWRRGDVFPNDNPLYLGMSGLGSPATVRERLASADALLVLGSRLGELTTYGYSIPAEGTRWAQVDMEPRGAGLSNRAEMVMASDVAAFLRVAQRLLASAALDAAGFDARKARNVADREAWEAATDFGERSWDGPGVDPAAVVETLKSLLPAETIVTSDAGDFGTWAARGFRFHRPGTFLATTAGAMGFGLPAAIGAALARPGRLAVALAGDGGFGMTMAELETAVRERAHVVAIVFDNGRYGTIWRHQVKRGGAGGLATGLGAVDYAAIAQACGALGLTVRSDGEFEPALRQAMDAGRPALLHLELDPRWTTPDELPGAEPGEVAGAPEPEARSGEWVEVEGELAGQASPAEDREVEPDEASSPAAEPGALAGEAEPAGAIETPEPVESAETPEPPEPAEEAAGASAEPEEPAEAAEPAEPAEAAEPAEPAEAAEPAESTEEIAAGPEPE